MSIFLPGTLFIVWAFPAGCQPRIWSAVFGIAILGIAVVIGLDLFGFLTQGGKISDGFMRAVFAVVMMIDIPLVALAVGSLACWLLTRGNRRINDRASCEAAAVSTTERSLEQ